MKLDHEEPFPDSKVHGANMGPIWGRQDPGGPHVGSMNFYYLGYHKKFAFYTWAQVNTRTWVLGHVHNRKCRNMCTRATFSSKSAKRMPKQLRGPVPKGMYSNGGWESKNL